jgi:prolyl-tRNA synthetase
MAKGITKRSQDYSQWYLDVIAAADLAEHSAVKGCMVIKPNGYALWEQIQARLDKMFKDTGHVNAYFPLFIPESLLQKEAEHVEGFAPECAVVTHGGGKKLEEPLFIRPTSETIIWSTYKKWIHSHRDLPILINQWANVVRWEMRTRLFLRTTEFLWQEGHTAHATYEEGEKETRLILDVYRQFAEDYLAAPVFVGVKTESEKFAGALHTYCIEAMMQDRKALQAGTSHNLGQNFAKAFDVTFQNEQGSLDYVWATSWGVSTRLIGALIMTHSDDNGLVIPPRLASTKVVFIPIWSSDEEQRLVLDKVGKITEGWKDKIDFFVDDRDQYRPGWKFNHWEKRGTPLRIEIGPKDVENNQVIVVRRDTGEKTAMSPDGLLERLLSLLETIQSDMFDRAKAYRQQYTFHEDNFAEFKIKIEDPGGFFWVHWCGSDSCEARFQEESKASIRLIPFDAPHEDGSCIVCGDKSERRVLVAKAY